MRRGKSAREFAIDLKKFGNVVESQALDIFKKIVLDLDSRIVLMTPVDTGRARGNWYPSINAPSEEFDLKATDKSGSKAMGRVDQKVSELKLGDVAWFTNNLPYILPLENGTSRQAPQGMVDLNLNAAADKYGGRITR